MIHKIKSLIIDQKNGLTSSNNIYIIDYKNINGGEVEVLDEQPENSYVHLSNVNTVEIFYVSLLENALKVNEAHGQVKQCECVLFPSTLTQNDWVLFIETKYVGSLKAALDEKIDYPNTMIDQIISSVNYFRDNSIIPHDRRVMAIISFPTIVENLSESIFARSKKTHEEILRDHKILIRATNVGRIVSQKRLYI